MLKCPHCGSKNGAYTTYTGTQYYRWDGKPNGFNFRLLFYQAVHADTSDNQGAYVRCVDCGKRVAKNALT